MKRKDMITLIKDKAQEITIKDLSQAIIEKARHLPVSDITATPRRKFPLELTLISSSLAIAFIMFLTIFQPAPVAIPQIENSEQMMALSAVSAVSLIEHTNQLLDLEENNNISLRHLLLDNELNYVDVNNEIDDVSIYFKMMERFLISAKDFDYEKSIVNQSGFDNQLKFTTTDMLDQELEYILIYNRTDLEEQNIFILQGILQIGNNSYEMIGEGELNNPQFFKLKVQIDNQNYIVIEHQIDNILVTTTQDGQMIQKIELNIQEINNQRFGFINFVEGSSTGSYAFEIVKENEVAKMRVLFYINGQNSESGRMDVIISYDSEGPQYKITVTPKGRQPFVIERRRESSNHQARGTIIA